MNIIGWLACIGVLVAMWMTGNKNRLGFIVGALAEVLWLVYAWQIQAFELGFMAVVFVGVYLRNYMRWKPITATESNRPVLSTTEFRSPET